MLTFEWDALRIGDRVAVHDIAGHQSSLLAGTVAMVERKRPGRRANGVGIRVDSGEGPRIIWPSHFAAHLGPPVAAADCWRCALGH